MKFIYQANTCACSFVEGAQGVRAIDVDQDVELAGQLSLEVMRVDLSPRILDVLLNKETKRDQHEVQQGGSEDGEANLHPDSSLQPLLLEELDQLMIGCMDSLHNQC